MLVELLRISFFYFDFFKEPKSIKTHLKNHYKVSYYYLNKQKIYQKNQKNKAIRRMNYRRIARRLLRFLQSSQ